MMISGGMIFLPMFLAVVVYKCLYASGDLLWLE